MGIEVVGTRVVHPARPTWVGTVVQRARCQHAWVVRWDHSGACTVLSDWFMFGEDFRSIFSIANADYLAACAAWREQGRGPA